MKNLFFNWFLTTHPKLLGFFGVFAGCISALLSLLIRMQLAFSHNSFLGDNYQFYNMIVLMDVVIMLFFLMVLTNLLNL